MSHHSFIVLPFSLTLILFSHHILPYRFVTQTYGVFDRNGNTDQTFENTFKGWVDDCMSTKRLTMLFTHKVLSDNEANRDYCVHRAEFVKTVQYVAQMRDEGKLLSMTMAEAYDWWTSANQNPGCTIVFAFDDGYISDYSTVWPEFKK